MIPKESNLIWGALLVFIGSAFAASGTFTHRFRTTSGPEVRVLGFVLLAIGGLLILVRYAWPLRELLKEHLLLSLTFWLLLFLSVVLPFVHKPYAMLMNNLPSAIHLGLLLVIGQDNAGIKSSRQDSCK